jgi:hypothetical protein
MNAIIDSANGVVVVGEKDVDMCEKLLVRFYRLQEFFATLPASG